MFVICQVWWVVQCLFPLHLMCRIVSIDSNSSDVSILIKANLLAELNSTRRYTQKAWSWVQIKSLRLLHVNIHTFCIYIYTFLPYEYVIMCYSTCVLLSYLHGKQMSTTFLTWHETIFFRIGARRFQFFLTSSGYQWWDRTGNCGICLSCSSLSPKLISSQTFLATRVGHCRQHPKKVLQ